MTAKWESFGMNEDDHYDMLRKAMRGYLEEHRKPIETSIHETLEPHWRAFKDGVWDGVIHGTRGENGKEYIGDIIHYYNRGYDFGISIYCELNPE